MKKSYVKIIILIELIGILMQAMSIMDAAKDMSYSIDRPDTYENEEDIRLHVSGKNQASDIDLSVLATAPTGEEKEAVLSAAQKEIDETFFGDNPSPQRVWRRVKIGDSYVNGMVEAQWDFSPGGIIDGTGNIDFEKVTNDTVITATCRLSAHDTIREYSFPFVVVMPDVSTPDGFISAVKLRLDEVNEDNESSELILPKEVAGERLTWKKPMEYRGLILCLLGAVTYVALLFGSRADEKKEIDKKREDYGRQYPSIVENLCLYVGAGISVRGAFEKMEAGYVRWKDKHPKAEREAYENIIIMNRAIRDGTLEADAYEAFGRNCMHPSYRKLSILLRQNLKRGNDRLLEQLSHEEQQVADERRREIKSAGELISTKLLIPMGGLLGMILIVLIYPALNSISL